MPFYLHNLVKKKGGAKEGHSGVFCHKNSTAIPIFQHFPWRDRKNFGKCNFSDLWEEVWEGKLKARSEHKKCEFVMLEYVDLSIWSVLERKMKKKML